MVIACRGMHTVIRIDEVNNIAFDVNMLLPVWGKHVQWHSEAPAPGMENGSELTERDSSLYLLGPIQINNNKSKRLRPVELK